MAPTAGILLTGGASRRLGVDKASLVLDGETLAARAGRCLTAVCEPVLEVGTGASGLPAIREDPPGAGPLAAMAAAGVLLRTHGHHGAALLLAVDLPRVDRSLLQFLRDLPGEPTAVPVADGRLQLVCARYGGDALLAAESLVVAGIRSLHELLDVVEYAEVGVAEWGRVTGPNAFADVDTPEDADRLGIALPRLA
jgi:molybdenum cofactor guanylyltransferase